MRHELNAARFAADLSSMNDSMQAAPEVIRPSKFWQELNRKHAQRLSESGIENFKRTLAKDYFTWMRVLPWDSQIRFLISQLPVSATMGALFGTIAPPKHQHIPLAEGFALNFLTRLIWAYAENVAPEQMARLSEPALGNPPNIRKGGRLISQDIANSVLEFQSFADAAKGTVCELGGGYGRTAFVTASLAPISKYIMVDISPALGVSQEYLGAVFPDKRHFPFRDFSSFEIIREEYEAADFVFLLPHQLALLPDNSVDLFLNISSLHEMRMDQIRHYLAEIYRLVRRGGKFYLKAWKLSKNPVENIQIAEDDYPLANWTQLYRRTPAVQTRFFETLLEKPA